jgi:uncharacterized protein YjiK
LNNSQTQKIISLTPAKVIKLSVPEPSGLCLDKGTNSLWTVSDEDTTIFNIDFSGKVLQKIKVNGFDLEGITFLNDSTLITILERSRTVVFLNLKGIEQRRFSLKIGGEPNEGLEGITYNSRNKHLYIIKEKNPCKLFETDLEGNVLVEKTLNISKDLSGLFYDAGNNQLWITSDESKSIYKCNPDGAVLEQFKVDIRQIEGITIDFRTSKLYLVSDPEQKLYIFDLP